MTNETSYTDGNALAGPLADVFAIDVTVGKATCIGCSRQSRVAELHVYAAGPGTIARCPGCGDPVLRYVRTPTAVLLDLRGTVSLSVPMSTVAT
ncbi:MAG: hypothetical protein QOH74_1132 [Gaiellales bacterium]|jgi:NAD-dependent SIR2 family protein deacetylase|nr:hypothetical protein [Gaiellales bacterium]